MEHDDERVRAAIGQLAGRLPEVRADEALSGIKARRQGYERHRRAAMPVAIAAALVLAVVIVAASRTDQTTRVDTTPAPRNPAAEGDATYTTLGEVPFPPVAAVWADGRLAIWGRHGLLDQPEFAGIDVPNKLAIWQPGEGWSLSPPAPLQPSDDGLIVWTGERIVVIDGREAAAFDPEQREWRSLPKPPPTLTGQPLTAVWTGDHVLVWGDRDRTAPTSSGAAWSARDDSWTEIVAAPAPINQGAGVWTGSELVVVGGWLDHRNQSLVPNASGSALAFAYSPTTRSWTQLAAPPLAPQATVVATARDTVIAWDYLLRAVNYEPTSRAWIALPDIPLDAGECAPGAISTPRFVATSYCGHLATFDPARGAWNTADLPKPAEYAGPLAWDGERFLVLSGRPGDVRLVAIDAP